MAVRHITDRALIAQAIYNRRDIRQRAMEIYQESLNLSVEDLMGVALIRYRRTGQWSAAYDLAVLMRLKPQVPQGHEVTA